MIKKFLLTLCVSVFWMYGFAQTESSSYTLVGNVDGLPDGTVVKMVPLELGSTRAMATATVKDSKFEFKGSVKEPTLVYVTVDVPYNGKSVILTNTNIQLKGTVDSSKTPSLSKLTVIGSPYTNQLYQKISVRDQLDKIYQDRETRFKNITELMAKAKKDGNKALTDSISKSDEWKAYLKADNDFFYTVENTFNKLFMDNKDTFFGPLLVLYLSSYVSPEMKPVYDKFSDTAKNSMYGKMLKDELYPKGLVGQKAVNFKVKNNAGKELSLNNLLKGKKYILVDFWASWCNPCRKEIPNLKAQYKLYSKKGFQIVSISTDREEAAWKKAVKEEQFVWPNFRDTTGEIANDYKIKFIPMLYLLDSTGKVVAENIRGEALANKLKELFQ